MTLPGQSAVFLGYHDIGCRVLKSLCEVDAEIVGVFTHADDPNEELWFQSVRELAEDLSLPVFQPENLNTPEVISQIKELAPDFIVSAYYRKLLKPELLRIPRRAALNLHGSLLPKYRGRAPVNWVLVNGETETGVSLHHMVEQADAGDIVAQKRVPIAESDTALTLFDKMTAASGELIAETWPLLRQGTAPRIKQDTFQVTYYGKRRPKDGLINWESPSQSIYNLVRAVTHPYPGAFTHFRGEPLFVWWGRVDSKQSTDASPGTLVDVNRAGGLVVRTGSGMFVMEHVEYEGVESTAYEFVNKHCVHSGERLGSER